MQPFHKVSLLLCFVDLVQIIASKFVVSLACAQHVISDHQHAVSDGLDRAFDSSPRGQTPELSGEIAVLFERNGPGGLAHTAA